MKKRLLTLFCLVATVLLAACGVKKVDAGESIKTTFTGLDTKGELVYQVDTQELVKEFLVANPKADAKTEAEGAAEKAASKVKEVSENASENVKEVAENAKGAVEGAIDGVKNIFGKDKE